MRTDACLQIKTWENKNYIIHGILFGSEDSRLELAWSREFEHPELMVHLK